MLPIQNFAIDNIYCASKQDKQFNFKLIRVNKETIPIKKQVSIYNSIKQLPDNNYHYHVFVIGNLNPRFINLLRQDKDWFKDTWINVAADMDERNYIFKLYNDKGNIYPREHIFYSFIDECSILIAMRFDHFLKIKFEVNTFNYLHLYSNSYFNSNEFNILPVRLGIKYEYKVVENNLDKVTLQNKINDYESNGGKAIVYVNGYITDEMSLGINNFSAVEVLYDQSIISKEVYSINDLRTFTSIKDNKLKYLLFRPNNVNAIQYYDDNELYISTSNTNLNNGIYYYQHKDYAIRNVTDKDYSLYTTYINNQAQLLSDLFTGAISDKNIIIYVRKSGLIRNMVYSNLKLHELYKLSPENQLNTLLGTGYTLSELRAENLENSDYFKIASNTNLSNLTNQLCSSTVGYNAITYYFANNPIYKEIGSLTINVPYLYQKLSLTFEYDINGLYLNSHSSTGPNYIFFNANSNAVEFLYGINIGNNKYYESGEVITLKHSEYKVLSAMFMGLDRITNWEDITNDTNKVTVVNNNIITVTETVNKKIKIHYFNENNIYDIQIPLTDGLLYFPLTVPEDRGTGNQVWPIDFPYANIEIFLNGYKLAYGLDFFMKFPYVNICNKKYLDYTKVNQDIHIRMYGFNLDITKINALESRGFVNHGVLNRNKKYDLRDDRLISIYIDGKLYNRNNIIFAEDDNTVRLTNPLNGLPYIIKEPYTPIKDITNLETHNLFTDAKTLDDKISTFFDLVLPEPNINETNVIADNYYLFSPTVSKVIQDLLDSNIPSTLYTNPYDDNTILTLLNTDYKNIYESDPVRFDLPSNIVVIQPHLGNSSINLNLHQYRFIQNLSRIIANNKINLSGYISVTT
ncbi:MAG: hypothetical protein ACD_33C00002G0007 [uncultured bacterium]|nr:MAG: hypothetical protein ACD_33C00002G0007 [uncultured bacterium]